MEDIVFGYFWLQSAVYPFPTQLTANLAWHSYQYHVTTRFTKSNPGWNYGFDIGHPFPTLRLFHFKQVIFVLRSMAYFRVYLSQSCTSVLVCFRCLFFKCYGEVVWTVASDMQHNLVESSIMFLAAQVCNALCGSWYFTRCTRINLILDLFHRNVRVIYHVEFAHFNTAFFYLPQQLTCLHPFLLTASLFLSVLVVYRNIASKCSVIDIRWSVRNKYGLNSFR